MDTGVKYKMILAAGVFAAFMCAYELAFKETINAYYEHRDLERRLGESADLSVQPAYLARKNHNLDRLIDSYRIDTANYRSNVLAVIAGIAAGNKVRLSAVPAPDNSDQVGASRIQRLDFEENYFDLMKTMKALETTAGIGMVRSITLRSLSLNSADSVRQMTMVVYFQMLAADVPVVDRKYDRDLKK